MGNGSVPARRQGHARYLSQEQVSPLWQVEEGNGTQGRRGCAERPQEGNGGQTHECRFAHHSYRNPSAIAPSVAQRAGRYPASSPVIPATSTASRMVLRGTVR